MCFVVFLCDSDCYCEPGVLKLYRDELADAWCVDVEAWGGATEEVHPHARGTTGANFLLRHSVHI